MNKNLWRLLLLKVFKILVVVAAAAGLGGAVVVPNIKCISQINNNKHMHTIHNLFRSLWRLLPKLLEKLLLLLLLLMDSVELL